MMGIGIKIKKEEMRCQTFKVILLVVLSFVVFHSFSGIGFASDSKSILFESREGEQWHLFLVDLVTLGVQQLTIRSGENRYGTWSPDGSRIAFVSQRDANRDIYLINLPSDNSISISQPSTHNLTRHPGNDFAPVWSPDGSKIAFVSDRDGDQEIYVMAFDGGSPQRLTVNESRDYSPNWSPDGSQLTFVSRRDGNYEIYSMSADGSSQRNLTHHPAEDGRGDHSWSPDGKKIAWITDRDMNGDANWEIYIMDAEGESFTNLTKTHSEERMSNAIWSPEGGEIAFVSYRDGNSEVYVMDRDGSRALNLSRHEAVDRDPVWSPDGKHIAFVSNRAGKDQIYTVSADGASLRKIASMEGEIGRLEWRP